MIRTTCEARCFGLWRDRDLLRMLADPRHLTTGRYEPIFRRQYGSGHVDLLFESDRRSCVLGAIRLDACNLITRERSPFVWPAHIAQVVDHAQLAAIERAITPWLRSISRARAMATESIRRFAPSERFDHARADGLVGAAALERTIPRMAPFLYARRFATNVCVLISCADSALAQAVLADCSTIVGHGQDAGDDDTFARAWYGLTASSSQDARDVLPDVVIVERRASIDAGIVIETAPTATSRAAIVEVPSPVPWDILFSFDPADAPTASRFGVYAVEQPLRECAELRPASVVGGSTGAIVLAVSAEALTSRDGDFEEVQILGRRLAAEGFRVHTTSDAADPVLADADLVHIFGARFESHTVDFGELALERGIDFLFDLPPAPTDRSAWTENTFAHLYSNALDDLDIARDMRAYEVRNLESGGLPQASAEDYDATESRFAKLSGRAAGVLCAEEDIGMLRAALPTSVIDQIRSRGVFAEPEPDAEAIGHLVPTAPFAFVHGAIAARSNSLYPAIAAERHGIPLVIAGSVYDVGYLLTLRAAAPSAIILGDAEPRIVSALYRRASVWIDAAPRPRSAARLIRALACGALPVLAAESPLSRIAGSSAPTFALTSLDDCARTLEDAIRSPDRAVRIAELQARLLARRDPGATFRGIIAAYSCTATVV
jgi:hypothetical protein